MDGENDGKPYDQMDDLGVPLFLETPILIHRSVQPGKLLFTTKRPFPNILPLS